MMMTQVIYGVFSASLCSTAIIIFFLVLRSKMLKLIGAPWAYYSWFISLTPWIAIWFPSYYFWSLGAIFNAFKLIQPLLFFDLSHKPIFSKLFFVLANGSKYFIIPAKYFFIIWLIGVFCSLLYVFLQHLRFTSRLKHNAREMSAEEKERIKKCLPHKQSKNLSCIKLTTSISSPLLCHLINPTIYLPENFFSYFTLAEQYYILQHEFFHLHRQDTLTNAIMLVMVCINWFNPFILLSYHYFRNSQELSCDSKVADKLSATEKKAYGYALLKTTVSGSHQDSKLNCWWNTGIALKERCQMLKFNHSKPIKILGGMLLFCCTLYAALAIVILQNRDTLFFYSIYAAKDADFIIKIFNNTGNHHPLHYSIKSVGKHIADGELWSGDENGQFFVIDGYLRPQASAEISVDDGGQTVWKGNVLFNENTSEIYTKTTTLDSAYQLGTHLIPAIHTITFDIKKNNR